MSIRMSYEEGIIFMQEKYSEGMGTFFPCSAYPELSITYPGYKSFGDYRVEVNNVALSHFAVCEHLHQNVKNGTYKYAEIFLLLEDVYKNGARVNDDKYTIPDAEKLIALIYWMTLQDESNFPQQKGFQGRRMPLSRYFEAIYCAEFNCDFDMQTIEARCFVRNSRPYPFVIQEKPSFYYM